VKKSFKGFTICILISFIVWLVPFSLRLSLNRGLKENSKKEVSNNVRTPDVVTKIFKAYSIGHKNEAFRLILHNNLKVALINIVGGVLFGIGTFVNLAQNGFYSASVFSTLHDNGMKWSDITIHTLPHSFEMLGIWLSGGLGFRITYLLSTAVRKDEYPALIDYKIIGIGILASMLIILFAAYVEAFISIIL
jgi:stage II sporulation protein M